MAGPPRAWAWRDPAIQKERHDRLDARVKPAHEAEYLMAML
jgi:hypothetical protein